MDVTAHLKLAHNVLAIRAINKHYGTASDPAGLLVVVTWQKGAGAGRLVSDHLWRGKVGAPTGWEQPDYDDTQWPAALALCTYPEGPWGDQLGNYPGTQAIEQDPRPLAAALPLALRA